MCRHGDIELTSVLRERTDLRVGDAIRLSAAPEHVHVFDRASGTRIACHQ